MRLLLSFLRWHYVQVLSAVSVPSTDGQIEFSESIGTQVYTFSAELAALYYNKQELTIDFDIGSQIPLLARESIPTIVTIP